MGCEKLRQAGKECLQVGMRLFGYILEIDGNALQLVGGQNLDDILRFFAATRIGQKLARPPSQLPWVIFCRLGRMATPGL